MKDGREELREDLEDISLNDEDLDEDLGEDLSGEDMSVDETDNSSDSGDKKKGSANGNKKKFPVIAVVGLIIVIIGVAVLGLVLGKKKKQNNSSRVAQVEVVEETTEVEAPTKASSQSAEEILARVRGENQDVMVDIQESETTEIKEPETDENGETVETTFNRGTRTEEIELENEGKYSVIVEKPTVNYKDIEYSQDIEATYTITKFKEKNKEIFYAEQGDEKFKVDRVDVVAEGSISGLTGTWELTLPYSVEWKLGDMITITYKMGEIDSSSRAIIDLKVKDYNKIESGVVIGDKNKKITKAVIPNS